MQTPFAVLFPGQGSQSLEMLSALAKTHTEVQETFEQASAILGYDAWALSQQGPAERLNETTYTQPLLLTAGVAAWRVLEKQTEKRPQYMAGHSLGEYTALVCAGACDFETGLRLVQQRAQAMQAAVPAGSGAMAAVLGLSDADVIAVCKEMSTPSALVSAVNFNAPGQVVIAGHADAVNAAITALKAAGAKRALALPVSVPSHCILMQSAADTMADALEAAAIELPAIPVVHNVNVSVSSSVSALKTALVEQLCQPVLWVETIKYLAAQNVNYFLEAGPGNVLAGLNKRIDKTLKAQPIGTPEGLQAALGILEGEE